MTSSLYYINEVREFDGILGLIDKDIKQFPYIFTEVATFIYRIWSEYWWMVFVLTPLLIVFNIWWTIWEGKHFSLEDRYKWHISSPSPADPKWKWRVWRIIRWFQYWIF